MLSVVEWLRKSWVGLMLVMWLATTLTLMFSSREAGYREAKAEGDKAVSDLRLEHAELRTTAVESNLVEYRQQVSRANQAESLLLQTQDQLKVAKQQLQERTAHVSTQYRPAPAAAPIPAPRCVFTRGWVRDFNLALGAGLPGTAAGAAAASADTAAWPAPGADAELLESGVRPVDILAHAQDYGIWAQSNLAQLNQLLDLQEKESR